MNSMTRPAPIYKGKGLREEERERERERRIYIGAGLVIEFIWVRQYSHSHEE